MKLMDLRFDSKSLGRVIGRPLSLCKTSHRINYFAFILFTDRFIRNLLFVIVLPVILAVLFVVAACVKVRPTRKSRSQEYEV